MINIYHRLIRRIYNLADTPVNILAVALENANVWDIISFSIEYESLIENFSISCMACSNIFGI